MRPLIVSCLLGLAGLASALDPGFVVQTAITPVSQPTCIAFSPSGLTYLGLKGGPIRVFNGSTLVTTFATISCSTESERGVLGLAFDPNFNTNHFVYVYYTTNSGSFNPPATPKNRVSRFTELNNHVMPGSETIIIDNIPSDAGNHNAGCIRFGIDGKLYIATGDGGQNHDNSQDLNSLAGKILRLNPDGTIPGDNPFVGQPNTRTEVFLYGLRNPFRFSVRPGTNTLYVADVGQDTWEEVNVSLPGGNYGWPIHEGVTGLAGFVDPVHQYNHNGSGAAITGGCFVGAQWPTSWQNRYIYGDSVLDSVRWLEMTANDTVSGSGTVGSYPSPVDFALGPDGALYMVCFDGKVRRIVYRPTLTGMTAPASVVGGSNGSGSVTINVVAPLAGTAVGLTSSNPTVLSVPASANVASGNTTGNFSFATAGVQADTNVTITASLNGTTQQKTVTVQFAPYLVSGLTLTPDTVISSQNSVGKVTLSRAAGLGGQNVTVLTNSGSVTITSPVTVPQGSTTMSFPIATSPTNTTLLVNIQAAIGSSKRNATLTLQPCPVQSITFGPNPVPGGIDSVGTVRLRAAAPNGGAEVTLLDFSNYVSVPASVTVPQGQNVAQFTVTTQPVGADTNVVVTASYGGGTRKATLTLTNALALASVTVNPTTIHGGQSSFGTVTLNKVVGTGTFVVTLSDNLSVLTLPPSVTVNTGQGGKFFTATTTPIGTTRVATITASANGITKTTTLTVIP